MADNKHNGVVNPARRRFLVGATAAAGLVTTASGIALLGCAAAPAAQANTATPAPTKAPQATTAPTAVATPVPTQAPATKATIEKVSWPLPYKKIDPEVVRKEGHKAYYAAGCCYGAFHGIMTVLQKEVGGPYNGIPTDMMKFGEGGGVGWGTLCGALNGSAAVINMVVGGEDWRNLINELFGWYTTFKFPSDQSNQYAEQGKFLVDKMKYDKALPQNASGSPLCHVSVTEWCKIAQVNVGDAKRAERCGRLTGDVAAQAVILLNAYYDKAFKAEYKPPAKAEECRTCHNSKSEFKAGGHVNTKMDCLPCHEDAHQTPKKS